MKTKLNLFQTLMFCVAALVTGSPAVTTFSDANWISISMGGTLPGANRRVFATVMDEEGNRHIGGDFTALGNISANTPRFFGLHRS
jgi:hypothetical protein